jgi:hypothetical protein
MKVKVLLIMLIVLGNGCGHPNPKSQSNNLGSADSVNADNYSEYLKLKESQSANKAYGHLGKVYQIISFEIPDTSFEGGLRQWIALDNPIDDIQQLADRDSLVIDATTVTLLLDYPLIKEFSFELKSPDGFTKGELVQMISKQYHEVYSIEEASASIKTVPPDKRVGMYNRNITNGKFGIWGHDLSDLVLSEVRLHRDDQGKFIVSLDIQS